MKNLFSNKTLGRVMLIALVMIFMVFGCGKTERESGIVNPSFEQAEEKQPLGWAAAVWNGEADLLYADISRTGGHSVKIQSEAGADAAWYAVAAVKPFSRYRLSGWVKTDNLEAGESRGALLNIHGMRGAATDTVSGTRDWTQVSLEFDTGYKDAVQINCLFGGWGRASGTAWYDDVTLQLLASEEPETAVVIQTDDLEHDISPYIYGQFIEHLGRCIYGGIWAEMLEDRKFFYAPGGEMSPWTVIGEPAQMTMVTADSYVGEHTPEFAAKETAAAGLMQPELGLTAEETYSGRIILAGNPEAAPVHISLIWGEGAEKKETVIISELGREYRTFPLSFTTGGSTDDGRLEITARGEGHFRIGTVSLMPEDNVQGMRPDVLQLLKELEAPVYRWPGGNFVSGYDWQDGIGDRDRRPPRKNPAWKGIESNDFGLHEFIAFCREIDTEPFITVNTGLGTADMAAGEVEYCNGSPDTPMGRLRVANGHPEPFAVKWWAVGNEMYGSWQLGHMPLEEYVEKHNQTAEAMRRVDPAIQLVAVGSAGRWSETMLRECADHMDLISEHFYCQEAPGLLAHIDQARGHIRRIVSAHREYRDAIPGLTEKDIPIAMDEWNYWYGPHVYGELGTRYFLKDALGIACGLHEYFRNADMVFMANYAQTVNVIGAIKTTKTAAGFAATGQVLKLYRKQFGDKPVTITGDMRPLDVSAAWKGDKLTLAVINPLEESMSFPISFDGGQSPAGGILYRISGDDPMAYNVPGEEPAVGIQSSELESFLKNMTVPGLSISLYVLDME
jgi:alpha-N-arabinofuranosidase